jgi:tetratricopeptide (TPR) repeat protein
MVDAPFFDADRLHLAGSDETTGAFDKWLQAVRAGDGAEAFSQASGIADTMKRLGAKNLFLLSDAALALARERLSAGDAPAALMIADHAVMMAPDNPDAHFFRALTQIRVDQTALPTAFGSLAAGVRATVYDKIRRDRFVADAVRYVFLTFTLTFLTTFLVMMWVYRRALLADLGSLSRSMQEGYKKTIVATLALLAPLAAGGWLVFLLAIPVFLWSYLRRGGRLVVGVFTALVVIVPLAIGYVAEGIVLSGADTYRSLYLLSRGTWDHETRESLERAAVAHPDDAILAYSMGLINKLRGEKELAQAFYDRAARLAAADPKLTVRIMVNKGNVSFVAREYPQAVAMYEAALKIDPQAVTAHFNLSNTYLEMVRPKEGEAAYRRAMAIDPKRTNALLEATGDEHASRVVDFPVTGADLATFEQALSERSVQATDDLWRVYMGPIDMRVYGGVVAGYVALLLLSGSFWSRRIAHQACATCGAPFRPPIALGGEIPKCNQCVAAQSSARGGVSSAKKDKKRKEIRDHMATRSRIASILDRLLPGVGRTFFGESVAGLLFTFVTSLFLVYGVSALIGAVATDAEVSAALMQVHALFLGAALIYWLVMNTALKREFY